MSTNSRIDFDEATERVKETIINGCLTPHKYQSKKYRTYVKYFADGLSIYAICHEEKAREMTCIKVITVIIEEGRP